VAKKDKSKKAKKLMKNAKKMMKKAKKMMEKAKKMMKKANKKEKELTSLQARALHAMRRLGRDDPDAELGQRANWLSAVPDGTSSAGAPSADTN
jgi:ATP/maltotriose-dependent transcriptional regulator MalT